MASFVLRPKTPCGTAKSTRGSLAVFSLSASNIISTPGAIQDGPREVVVKKLGDYSRFELQNPPMAESQTPNQRTGAFGQNMFMGVSGLFSLYTTTP